MDWLSLYFELPVFQRQFKGAVTCPFKKLYVAMTLYSDVINRNEVVQHATEVNSKHEKPTSESGKQASIKSEEACKSMLEFEWLHLVLQPELVTSVDHVSYAVSRALTNVLSQKVHSGHFATEVVYMMGGSSSVTKCMEEMCIQPCEPETTCKSMLIVTISKPKKFGNIDNIVKGIQMPIEKLTAITDQEKVIRTFKCSKDELELPGGLNACILMRIGTKRI
ncbi:hypothetical protein X943_002565 [Babesia divergens]|uniref:Uncharacterized protein n=1 Tax=Babesia divergens TaxID=32595 RepID=A0AAD9GAL7_BABDI|nr:hypothetical protein X943_002565 [Babesia divergens]